MNLKKFSNKLTSSASIKMLKAKKQSPTIMFGAGVVGVVATVVLASRATLRLEEVLEDTQIKLGKADKARAEHPDKYADEDHKRDQALTYAQAVVKVGKLYGPAIIVGAASIGLLTGAHVTLTRRNGALTAAYVAVDQAYRQFEQRVKDEFGEDKARELKYGVDTKEVYSEGKNGEPIVDQVKTAGGVHMYARLFGPDNPNWNPTPETNMFFLRGHQNWLNDKLDARGYVTLNEAYDALGMERSKAGHVVGWLSKEHGGVDGYIDFGIWDSDNMLKFHDFMTGREDSILIDFNVDGEIYSKL